MMEKHNLGCAWRDNPTQPNPIGINQLKLLYLSLEYGTSTSSVTAGRSALGEGIFLHPRVCMKGREGWEYYIAYLDLGNTVI